jgi:signal peptidase I
MAISKQVGDKRGNIGGLSWQNKLLLKRVITLPSSYVDIDENGNVSVDGNLMDEPLPCREKFCECDIEFPYQVLNDKQFVMGNNWTSSSEQPQLNCGLY